MTVKVLMINVDHDGDDVDSVDEDDNVDSDDDDDMVDDDTIPSYRSQHRRSTSEQDSNHSDWKYSRYQLRQVQPDRQWYAYLIHSIIIVVIIIIIITITLSSLSSLSSQSHYHHHHHHHHHIISLYLQVTVTPCTLLVAALSPLIPIPRRRSGLKYIPLTLVRVGCY